MQWAVDAPEDRLVKLQILAFVEEHWRALTLADVGEWYAEVLTSLIRP